MLSLSPIRGGASGASSYYLAEEKNLNLPDAQFVKGQSNESNQQLPKSE